MDNQIDWSKAPNARDILRNKGVESKPVAPTTIDKEVSKIIGRPIRTNDPRLIQEVNKWRQYNTDEKKFDNHLKDPKKIADLRKIFSPKKSF